MLMTYNLLLVSRIFLFYSKLILMKAGLEESEIKEAVRRAREQIERKV